MTQEVQIAMATIPFPFSLIALKLEGLDVILGMDWLACYRANLDCAAKTVTVNHPIYGLVRYWSPSSKIPTTTTPSPPETNLYLMEGVTPLVMHEVEVVCDFPDIFAEELHGMPPDRRVEFVIELTPADRKSTRLNSSHSGESRMPSSA